MLKNSKILKELLIGFIGGLIVFISSFITFYVTKKQAKIVYLDLDETKTIENEEPAKYPFLQKEISDYICKLSEELKINSDLVVSILLVENPQFNPDAVHRNENGTIDFGLFQINDKYTWSTFIPKYWQMDIEFNPFNWKHNAFLAMHHIEYLSSRLKIQDEIIMAYNCGEGAVRKNQIPESTKVYLSRVKNNLKLLNNLN